MADQKAVRPDWKISTIPKDASNATDPIVASNKEIEAVIANPSSLKPNTPLESDEVIQKTTELDTPPRFNANLPYTPQPTIYSMNDQILMQAIRVAVKNGWPDYHRFANNAVTIGMEAEAVVEGMKKQRQAVDTLLFKQDFCKYVWPKTWKDNLAKMIVSDDQMKYLEGHLSDG